VQRRGDAAAVEKEDRLAAAFRDATQLAEQRRAQRIAGLAAKIDDAALREAQQRKDAVAAYELVYAALGA
jgi:hypothetical protein